ncbi:hypothetical protein [Halpernia frigidisoli]|uniref:Uncharacterized protein n=1 Tax=Halpernia frigidisoli TaxID=1125876 RepID=A0A1I3DTW5_9FLAO|nr:hypothetical protein [Halpernia frigidisoli]SFH89941.1 hypothetical protein SAMN05443292_0694 [Halpernia frigidisoli]
MKYLCCPILLIFVISCSKKETTENKKLTIPDSAISSGESAFRVEKIPENCYLMVTGKDSAAIHLVDNLGTVSGEMVVKNSEKDSSSGELAGFISGDTLKLDYTFQSEGVTSENDIYFLQKENELIQGLGDYKNTKSLKFDTSNNFKKSDCNLISKILK